MKTLMIAVLAFSLSVADLVGQSDPVGPSVVLARKETRLMITRTLEPKNPTRAMLLGLGHTAIPIAAGVSLAALGSSNVEGFRLVAVSGLIGYGFLLGPSAGNFYAGDYVRGGLGVVARAVGGLMVISSIGQAMSWGNDDEATGPSPGQVRGTIGTLIILGSTMYNILSASGSAEKYNAKHGLTGIGGYYDRGTKAATVTLQLTF